LSAADKISIERVHVEDNLIIAGKSFHSRLFIGTGKYAGPDIMAKAIEASGTEMVTVALRRVDIANENDNMLAAIDRTKYLLLPNTSGARDSEEAVRLARLARAASGINWVKLEVTPDPYYLLPDPIETLKAAEILVKEGFIVLPYINADPVLAKRLQDVGTATIMPLAAPIGSNQGLKTQAAIEIIIEQATVPVVVDAGLGLPSHASAAMELGADAVLVNTAIAAAQDPVLMAGAFKRAVEAGRMAFKSGSASVSRTANASSPLTGFLRS
jgi:thiazole synthase